MRAFYDAVAAEYAEQFADELSGKPLDRVLLERFAAHEVPIRKSMGLTQS